MKHITLLYISIFIISIFDVKAEEIKSINLHNKAGNIKMTAINYGARIPVLEVNGTDIVLGFDTLQHYIDYRQNFGAVVGRYIGRILGGKLTIDGKEYNLQTGSNGDCSHGGTPSFSQRFFSIESNNDTSVVMRYVSPDGENGFPGELNLSVTYTLTDEALRIDYEANTTHATVLNPSNHTFFNLSGNLSNDILEEVLWIDSDSIALYNDKKRVTGELGDVTDTPFDFRQPKPIGRDINEENTQLYVTKGYDHCYQLKNNGLLTKPVARLYDKSTDIIMEVYTTEPAMQIYTANGHNGTIKGKEGKPYRRRNAICFETMHFPDSPNKPHWPSTLLRPGETFRSTTIFRFPNCRK